MRKRPRLVPALFAFLVLAHVSSASAGWHVRALTPGMSDVLAAALSRSAFVRSCAEALEGSDLIVYLVDQASPTVGGPRAYLRLLSVNESARFVIVSVDRWTLGPNESIVMLAHELQHAVELAQAPAVRDAESFGALYRRIGWELGHGHFETDAARLATLRARVEVAG